MSAPTHPDQSMMDNNFGGHHPSPTGMNDIRLDDDDDDLEDYGHPPVASPGFTDGTSEDFGVAEIQKGSGESRRSRFMTLLIVNKWLVGFAFVVLIVVIVLVSVLASGGGSKSSSAAGAGEHQKPIRVGPGSVDPARGKTLMDKLVDAYGRHTLDASPLNDETLGETKQRLAFYWLGSDSRVDTMEHYELIQRYVLAVLYYYTNHQAHHRATNPLPWKTADKWLSDAHSCDWQGIVCNDDGRVISIDLSDNHLSGSMPIEMVMLGATLEELNLSSNFIHVEGNAFDFLTGLTQLQTLLFDDNFLVSKEGLPRQMHHLVNLRKLRASYNLLEGPMDPENMVFGEMSKLTHLELESNFFTEDIPPALLNKPSLVYLYLRRNDMTIDLDFLKNGNFPNLFALWLDNNAVKGAGTIPPEIGKLTELASLSMTNTTVQGPIPTEIGNLRGLRRLWLYDNNLNGKIPTEMANLVDLEVFEIHNNGITGNMPQAICNSVQKSEYAFKALTSDCGEVNCPCCTKCY